MVREKAKAEVNTWREEIAAEAAAAKATEDSAAGAGSWVSLKGGRISIDGAEVPGNALEVIVLDHILENQFYDVDYDPNNPASPVCYAYGRHADEMAPHPACEDPQNEPSCKGCADAAWGSGKKGKGKACKEVRRLALIVADDAGNAASAEVRMLKLPVMSCKNWTGYVRHCADVMHLPPLGVVTQMRVVPDEKSQFRVEFSFVEKVAEEHLPALLQRKRLIEPDLFHPHEVIEKPPPPPARASRKYGK